MIKYDWKKRKKEKEDNDNKEDLKCKTAIQVDLSIKVCCQNVLLICHELKKCNLQYITATYVFTLFNKTSHNFKMEF